MPTTDRAAVGELLKAMDWLDLIVPRGGRSLIDRVTAESRVPVLRHYDGICHVYVDRDADIAMARDIVANAKMRRVSVCGAAETLLIDSAALDTHLMPVLAKLHELGCEVRGDAEVQKRDPKALAATEKDWRTEYLEPIICVATVDGVAGAIDHIARYGSQHTESIVTGNAATAERFLRKSTAPSSCTMPARSSPTAASSAWARRSASRPTACMPADRSAWSSSRPTRTSCAARARCAHELVGVISAHHPMPGVPRDTRRRIGLLGGSFNPAHDGHRHVSLEALKRLGLDEVWWLVSPQNPLKSDDGMEPLATRLARAQQLAHHPHIRVEAPELLLGTRYTLDTVRALNQLYPHAHFVWLMGADILPQLVDWQGWRELFAGDPDRRLRATGLELRRPAVGSPPRLRALPDCGRQGAHARLLSAAGLVLYSEPPRQPFRHGDPRRAAPPQPKRKERPSPTRPARFPTEAKRPTPSSRWCAVRWRTTRPRTSSSSTSRASRAFADYMVIATGRSNRQVVAIADHLADRLKQAGHGPVPVEGKQGGDWVLVDAGDVVVHVFRPEPRAFYALEKMWALENEVAAKPKATRRKRT